MILTTSRDLDASGQVLRDLDLAAAIIDRVLALGKGPSPCTIQVSDNPRP